MIELNAKQRALLADKFFDAGNVAAGGMIFGQFVSERRFSLYVALAGLAIWLVFFAFSVTLEGRTRR